MLRRPRCVRCRDVIKDPYKGRHASYICATCTFRMEHGVCAECGDVKDLRDMKHFQTLSFCQTCDPMYGWMEEPRVSDEEFEAYRSKILENM